MYQINEGPFAGAQFTDAEVFQRPDSEAEHGILMGAMTQRFLQKFNPTEGWSVEIKGELIGVDMPPIGDTSPVPCALFKAELRSPENRVVATASSVWTITGPTAWEKGETNARQRLYAAAGLALSNRSAGSAGPADAISITAVENPPDRTRATASQPPAALPVVEIVEWSGEVKAVLTDADAEAALAEPHEDEIERAEPDVVAVPEQASSTNGGSSPSHDAPRKKRVRKEKGSPNDPVPSNLLVLIQNLCRLRNQTPPSVKTRGEAEAKLRELRGG